MQNLKKLGYIFIILAIAGVTGCSGVSSDEYEKVLAELDKTRAELQKANDRIAEMEGSGIQIPKIDTGAIEKLLAAQQKGEELAAKVRALTDENKTLSDNLAKLQGLADSLQEKLKALQNQTKDLPFDLLKK